MAGVPPRVGCYEPDGASWSGAMGTVHSARHRLTGARVALKLSRAGDDPSDERFEREIALLARLSRAGHPGVPALLDAGRHEGRPFYAMRFVDGQTLRSWVDALWKGGPDAPRGACSAAPPAANGRLPEVLAIAGSLARTLAYVHAQGVVHCDLSPSNVVIEPSGAVVLVDFGSAVATFSVDTRRELGEAREGGWHGTVGYVAPEQLSGRAVDSRCDMYAFGCILYELCTGRLPFADGDAHAVAAQHLYSEPPRPSARVSDLPEPLEGLILRLLAKDRSGRPAFADDIARELLLGDDGPANAPARGSTVHLYRPSLIGRDDALQRLLTAAAEAVSGRGGWVVVSGESGIGKTRLIAELGVRLAREPVLVLYGACVERGADGASGTRSPLAPFQPLFRALRRSVARAAQSPLPDRLLPHLRALAPYHAALDELPGVSSAQLPELPLALGRKRVLRALRECLVELSRLAPLVLVLDDLHGADELTREFLGSEQLGNLRAERVLLLGGCRAEQMDDELSTIVRSNASAQLVLQRLTASDVRLLVKEMLAEDFPPNGFVDYLHHQSEGNPFFVAEYLRVALETGAIRRTERAEWMFPEVNAARRQPYASLPMPDSLSSLARMRLASTPDAERRVLHLAAILGRQFDPRHLEPIFQRIAPDARESLREALHELVRRQLLEADDGGRLCFAHATLREAALEGVDPDTAVTLHRAVAELLETNEVTGTEASVRAADIGMHWAFAREPARAVERLKQAARLAESTHSYEQAIDLYAFALEQALSATGEAAALAALSSATHPGSDASSAPPWRESSEVERLSELLGDLLCRTAKYDRARKQYAFTIERTPPTQPLALARLWRKYAETLWRAHEHKQALLALARAEQQLGSEGSTPDTGGEPAQEWISLQQARLTIHYFTDPHGAETRLLIEAMLPAVSSHGTPEQKSYFYQCAANERAGRQRYRFTDDLVALERRALSELMGVTPVRVLDLNSARFDLAFMLLLGGRAECEQALPLLTDALGCAEELEDMTLLARSLNYLSIAYRRLGDAERTRSYAQRTRQIAELAHITPYLGATAANLGWLAWREGGTDEASTLLAQARSWWARAEHVFPFQWLANWVLLELQASADDFPAARATLADLLAPLQQAMPEPLERASLDARSACESGPPRAAEHALRVVLAMARESLYL